MGSIARSCALERYIKAHGEERLKEYEHLLGKKVVEFLGTEVDYYVKSRVRLDDGEEYSTHFRWASGYEDDTAQEDPEEDFVPMEEYYQNHIIGKTITSIDIGVADRDDEVYIIAFVDEEQEHCLEIPLGVDPEGGIDKNGDLIE